MKKVSRKNSEEFFNEMYKFSCRHFLTLNFFVLLTISILSPLLPAAIAFIYTTNNVMSVNILKVILIGLYIVCIINISLVFIRDKLVGRNKKYEQKLRDKLKQNGIFKASEIKQLKKEKDYLLDKNEKERNVILDVFINFFKLLIIPASLSLYNLLTPHRAFILLSYLFFISLELFIFYWKDFDFMKSVGVKNKYKYTQVQRELEFAEEVFEREERMEQLNQNE